MVAYTEAWRDFHVMVLINIVVDFLLSKLTNRLILKMQAFVILVFVNANNIDKQSVYMWTGIEKDLSCK